MLKLKQPRILNAAGQPIALTARETAHAAWSQRQVNDRFENDLGYEISITTLTTLVKKISEQKFFEVAPADYLPVRVGEGTWSASLTTYRSFDIGGDFAAGVINTGGQNARQAVSDSGVDAITIKVNNWVKAIGWSIFDLEQAAKSGNWDIVSSKEKARKRNWDLGIQKVAFLGLDGLNQIGGTCLGLLNQAGVTNNATVITKPLSEMTPTELKTFQTEILNAYRANCNRTAWPTHFIIPESDYLGLAGQASAEFPVKSTLALLEEAFQTLTRNKAFKILPLAYADAEYHADVEAIVDLQVYTLLNYEEESVRMDIPLDYTNTLANSIDNFSFQNSGYGQFTGVQTYRPLEMLYFTF